jgi:endonuclease/exonuclease/phosphatase family metal-dependent hydrolase
VRIATYNVHKCCGLDRRMSPARIVQVLQEVDADIVALQEVVTHRGRGPEADQAGFMADCLGLSYAFGENRKHRGGGYGNLVLSRFPICLDRNYDLSVRRNEKRGCLRVDLDAGGGLLLHVFNVHLGTAYNERRFQGRRLTAPDILRGEGIGGPRVVLGDFNEWTRGLTTRLLTAELRSADMRTLLRRRRTYPGLFPLLHLDHIYYDPLLHLEALTLHRSRVALVASDHLPLVADFRIHAAAGLKADAGPRKVADSGQPLPLWP